MERNQHLLQTLKNQTFDFLNDAELDKLNPTEKANYYERLKNYRDLKNIINTAHEEGRKEGLRQVKLKFYFQVAKEMKNNGEAVEWIMKYTKLTEGEIERL